MGILIRLRLWLKNIKCKSKCCEFEEHNDIIINVDSHKQLDDSLYNLKERGTDSPINIVINSRK
jgi:hypothetical protein